MDIKKELCVEVAEYARNQTAYESIRDSLIPKLKDGFSRREDVDEDIRQAFMVAKLESLPVGREETRNATARKGWQRLMDKCFGKRIRPVRPLRILASAAAAMSPSGPLSSDADSDGGDEAVAPSPGASAALSSGASSRASSPAAPESPAPRARESAQADSPGAPAAGAPAPAAAPPPAAAAAAPPPAAPAAAAPPAAPAAAAPPAAAAAAAPPPAAAAAAAPPAAAAAAAAAAPAAAPAAPAARILRPRPVNPPAPVVVPQPVNAPASRRRDIQFNDEAWWPGPPPAPTANEDMPRGWYKVHVSKNPDVNGLYKVTWEDKSFTMLNERHLWSFWAKELRERLVDPAKSSLTVDESSDSEGGYDGGVYEHKHPE